MSCEDLTLLNIKLSLHGLFPDSEADLLGEYLGIHPSIIKTFKDDYGSDSARLLSKVINHWLNNDSEASWNKLADAVKVCKYDILAESIRTKSIRLAATSMIDQLESAPEDAGKNVTSGIRVTEPAVASGADIKDMNKEQDKSNESDKNSVDPDMYSHHMSLLLPAARPYLDEMVDWNHGNVCRDRYEIAHHLLRWDTLAPQLGLDDVDIADIKEDYRTAEQQRIAALTLWMQKTVGTYHDLLKVCCAGGDSRTAAVICDIVNKKVEEHGQTASDNSASDGLQ